MSDKAIDVETMPAEPSQAVAVRADAGAVSTQRMTVDELKANLAYIREIMQNVMTEGQDYGKIPGCGEKPALLQPGAQKLCMTFRIQPRVKKEEVKDLPGLHREYSFTLCLVSTPSKEWDGVGTCSTLESKYRYRKAERRCPKCGHNTIIQGKAEYGGGWICFKKKGGCGEKFPENDQRITSQPGGTVEYENPPDYWNTVRKMAFKRALVHAAINATNTSELWTQDVEEMVENTPPRTAPAPAQAAASGGSQHTSPPVKTSPAGSAGPSAEPKPAENSKSTVLPFPTPESRARMIAALKAGPGEPNREIVTEYFRKLENPAQLMPNEELESLPLRFVPATTKQMAALADKLMAFGNGERAAAAFPAHPEPEGPQKPIEVPRENVDKPSDQDAWRTFPMPFGKNAGVILEELEKNYLYGLWANYTVETEYKGKPKRPESIAKDQTFRAMLDLAGKHYEFTKKD